MTAPATQQFDRRGIGGSQAAAAVGLNRWCAPIQLWQQLTEGFEQPENPAMKWGKILEAPIRQEYADQMGVRVVVPKEPVYRDEWKRAHPDGLVVDADDQPTRGLEVKTAGAHLADEWGDAGTDQVPIHYAVQCAWYMHVTDLPRWDLVTLIGGRDFRPYRLERDLEFEADLVAGAEEFWLRYVLPGVPPPVDASSEYRDYLVRRWGKVHGEYRAATEDEEDLVADLLSARAAVKQMEGQRALLENQLRAAIADAAGLESTLGRVHCKPQVRRTVNWEALARELATRERLSEEFLLQLVKEHTQESPPFRPLRLPREEHRG